jgi:hypothetical protein
MRNCFFTCNIRLSNRTGNRLHYISCIAVHWALFTTISTLPQRYPVCKCEPIQSEFQIPVSEDFLPLPAIPSSHAASAQQPASSSI